MIKKINLIITLILFAFPTNSVNSTTFFLDNFDDGQLNPVWIKKSSQYMDFIEENGKLEGVHSGQNVEIDEWRRAHIEKPFDHVSTKWIDLDFKFDFKEMGHITLRGYTNNGTETLWIIGYIDTWSYGNGIPAFYGYTAEEKHTPESYPVSDFEQQNEKINFTAGEGHITVQFLSENLIKATIYYPGGISTRELPLYTVTETIQISIYASGLYHADTDYWGVDNYIESDTFNENNFSFSTFIPSNSFGFEFSLETFGIIGIGLFIGILIFYVDKKKNNIDNRNVINPNKVNSDYNPYSKNFELHLCPECSAMIEKEFVFCENCGKLLK